MIEGSIVAAEPVGPAVSDEFAPAPTPEQAERRETMRYAVVVFAATAIVNAANFGFNLGAVHLLGLGSYSAVAALLAMVLILSVPANVIQAVIATVVGEIDALDEARASAFSRAIAARAFTVSLGIAIAGLLVARPVAAYLETGGWIPVLCAFGSIALGLSTAALRGALQGQQRFVTFSWSLVIEASGNVVFGLGLIAAFHTVSAAMIGNVCAVFSALLFSALAVLLRPGGEPPAIDARRIVVKCLGTTGALGAIAAMSWADVVLVRHLSPGTFASLYGVLSILGKVVIFSVSFIPFVLLARASKLAGQRRPTAMLLYSMLAVGACLCFIDLLVIGFFPVPVLTLLGGSMAAPAAPYAGQYAFALASLAMTTIFANYAIGMHRFTFVVPLVIVEAGEIVTINLYHPSLEAVVRTVLVGHLVALALVAAVVSLEARAATTRFRQGSA